MRKVLIVIPFLFSTLANSTFATDITGIWKNIDDKTGSSKAILKIHQEKNHTYTAKIIKITPRPGYTAKEICVNCPAPYTNKPILGMEILKGLQLTNSNIYSNGKIIDPLTGKIYNTTVKLSSNGKRLTLHGSAGAALGRNQIWLRDE